MATEAPRARWRRVGTVAGVWIWLWAGACASAGPQPAPAQLPNPAARKCVEDGYDLQPVRDAAGLPVDHECVDPRSGRRCGVWDYFRGSCGLSGTPSPREPTANAFPRPTEATAPGPMPHP